MDLFRFAVFETQIAWPNEGWKSFALKSEAATVHSFSAWESGGKLHVLVGANVGLDVLPGIDANGLVQVPIGPRTTAEAAIEEAANYIAVISGARCQISSPRLSVAFRSDNPAELATLRRTQGLIDFESFVPGDTFSVMLEPTLISSLSDRSDGVALLASALATTDLPAIYRDLLRVFERAFALSSNRLTLRLAGFLGERQALAYSKSEVKRWIVGMRGAAIHADRNRPLLSAADFRPVVNRMLFAGYDVLFNKRHWHKADQERRKIWEPTYGPAATEGFVGALGEKGVW